MEYGNVKRGKFTTGHVPSLIELDDGLGAKDYHFLTVLPTESESLLPISHFKWSF